MRMKNENTRDIDRYFTRRMFSRQFLPALISAVALSFGDVADSFVLGNSIGSVGLAALALVMPVAEVFNVIMIALGTGGSVRYASRMAQGRRKEALSGFHGVVCVAAISGILIAAAGNLFLPQLLSLLGADLSDSALFAAAQEYLRILLIGTPALFLNYVLFFFLRADNMEKEANVAFTAGNITDILMNVVFVFLMHMGVKGAALATVIGQTTGMTISILMILSRKGTLRLTKLKPDFREAGNSFRIGFASSIGFIFSMIFLLIANKLLLRSFGGDGIAILEVVLCVSYFMINLYDAVAKSILPVVSTYSGEHNENGMKLARNLGLEYAVAMGVILALVVCLFPEGICRFFGVDTSALLEQGRDALRLYGLSIPLAGAGILLTNYHEAKQDFGGTMFRSVVRGLTPIVLAVLFTFLAPRRFWLLYLISRTVSLILFGVWYRFVKEKQFDPGRVFCTTLYSTSNEISRATGEIEAFAGRWDASPGQRYMTMMAMEEICVATMNNGFMGKEDGFIQIVLVALEDGSFTLHIRDNAETFNPLAMELGGNIMDENANLEALGIAAIRKKASSFSYRHYQGFNTVIIQM